MCVYIYVYTRYPCIYIYILRICYFTYMIIQFQQQNRWETNLMEVIEHHSSMNLQRKSGQLGIIVCLINKDQPDIWNTHIVPKKLCFIPHNLRQDTALSTMWYSTPCRNPFPSWLSATGRTHRALRRDLFHPQGFLHQHSSQLTKQNPKNLGIQQAI
jgi:hypothetical protein